MKKAVILCLEDEPEVRNGLERDLQPFANLFDIESVEDVEEAKELLATMKQEKRKLALALCDHILPGLTGVEFLVALNHNEYYADARKVLVTGQAGHADTILAINEGALNYYISKPWQPEDLRAVVRNELTQFVLASQDDLMPYLAVLDQAPLLEAIGKRNTDK